MFHQVKSALFWYYLIKFRKRVFLVFILLLTAFFADSIYEDIISYLKAKNDFRYFQLILLAKWFVVIFNMSFSLYLILSVFKPDEKTKALQKEKEKKQEELKQKQQQKQELKQKQEELKAKIKDIKKQSIDDFSTIEKKLLEKSKLQNKADYLLKR